MKPHFQDGFCIIYHGDALKTLKGFPDESIQCCVTSPPYWGLRDYGVDGQLGLEKTPKEYVANMVEVFREVRRVLKKDGTCWVNLGDTYASAWACNRRSQVGSGSPRMEERMDRLGGLKEKDLVGIPWRVAFALQEDGWYLRSDIIWHKPNPMPESVTDRPTKAHEYIFLLTKSERYFYDAEAIKEPVTGNAHARGNGVNPKAKLPGPNSRIHVDRDPAHTGRISKNPRQNESFSAAVCGLVDERNKRSVWRVATYAFPDAHFATYPPELIRPCILAGTKAGDIVLDPFGGSGTTGQVALELGRRAMLIELNKDYLPLIEQRTMQYGFALK